MSKQQKKQSQDVQPPRSRRQVRKSTIEWVKHLTRAEASEQKVVQNLDRMVPPAELSTLDVDTDAVNIMVLGGGGLRGYAHPGMWAGLLELNAGQDFLQHFDLVGGSSVGAVAALHLNHHGNFTADITTKAVAVLDDVFANHFTKRSWKRLLSRSALTGGKSAVGHVFRRQYGDVPLYNPNGVNTFLLSAVKRCDGVEDGKDPEPFVFRTYDLPPEQDQKEKQEGFEVCAGTNEFMLWEAMGATAACPVLADRMRLDINGEQMRFADGAVISNNPVAVAITEALRLWPHRPIGVVMLLGLDEVCPTLASQAVSIVKRANPDIQLVSLTPQIDVHALFEDDHTKLMGVTNKAKNYVLESTEASNALKKIKSSRPRGWKKRSVAEPSARHSFAMWRHRRVSCTGNFFKQSDKGRRSSFLRSFESSADNKVDDVPEVVA